MIELSKFRPYRGTHYNYVIEFSGGTTKVGVTQRPNGRLIEVVREYDKEHPECVVTGVSFSPPGRKNEAFKAKKKICILLKKLAIIGHRDWFRTDANHVLQTSAMFWNMYSTNGVGYVWTVK